MSLFSHLLLASPLLLLDLMSEPDESPLTYRFFVGHSKPPAGLKGHRSVIKKTTSHRQHHHACHSIHVRPRAVAEGQIVLLAPHAASRPTPSSSGRSPYYLMAWVLELATLPGGPPDGRGAGYFVLACAWLTSSLGQVDRLTSTSPVHWRCIFGVFSAQQGSATPSARSLIR